MHTENKIATSSFANRISYSSPNEDSESELKALNIGEKDTILCVTGGGDRVLNLALKNPKKIIAIDLNPNQNYLLELKIAGINSLNYHAFLEFSGILPCRNRITTYNNKIKHLLTEEGRNFWSQKATMLHKGVFYEGTFEKYFSMISILFKILKPRAVVKLLSFTNLADQREYVTKKWNTPIWKIFLHFLTNKYFFKFILKDPGFYEYVPQDLTVSKYLISRMDHSLMNHLVSKNFFMTFLLTGKYKPDQDLPIYLQENNYKFIKKWLTNNKIELITEPLEQYLSYTKNTINKFSLSDISAYLSEDDFISLLNTMYSVSAQDSVFCLRHFITKRRIPEEIKSKYKFNKKLEKELNDSDKSFVYSFNVGTKIS